MEGFYAAVMIAALIIGRFSCKGIYAWISADTIETWMIEDGITFFTIIVIGVILWIFLKKAIPLLVYRTMAKPVRGESREGRKRRADTLQNVFSRLTKFTIIIVVLLIILDKLTVPLGPILAGLGVAGVAVGFGAQYLVKDLIAGIFILMENQYRVGDRVIIANVEGIVEEINLRKTVLRDLDGIVHHVPNGEITVASNRYRHFGRINLNVSVAYDTDLDHAISVINRVCLELAEEEEWSKLFRSVPQVLRVDNLGDSGIEIKILGDVKPMEQWKITGQLRLRLKKAFDIEGIEIPVPHTKVYFGNELKNN